VERKERRERKKRGREKGGKKRGEGVERRKRE